MSVEDNQARCDRCDVGLGNGSPLVALVVTDVVDGGIRNYHFCRDRLAEGGEEVQGCARQVLTDDLLAAYRERNPEESTESMPNRDVASARAAAAAAPSEAPLAEGDADGAPPERPDTPAADHRAEQAAAAQPDPASVPPVPPAEETE